MKTTALDDWKPSIAGYGVGVAETAKTEHAATRHANHRKLAGLENWLFGAFMRLRGNARHVQLVLAEEKGIRVSSRTVQRAVQPYRHPLHPLRPRIRSYASFDSELVPGHQIQVGFDKTWALIGCERARVNMLVATLSYSERCYCRAFADDWEGALSAGLEGAFARFGGVPEEVLVDGRAARRRELIEHLQALGCQWGFHPDVCLLSPASASRRHIFDCKNAIVGRSFETWTALDAYLMRWTREVADVQTPLARFEQAEAQSLRPIESQTPTESYRRFVRIVMPDCTVRVYSNAYSVPWRLKGERVRVEVGGGRIRISYHGQVVAEHAQATGLLKRIVHRAHFASLPECLTTAQRRFKAH